MQQVVALVYIETYSSGGDDAYHPESNNGDPFSDPPSVPLFNDSPTDILEGVEVTTLQSGTTGG